MSDKLREDFNIETEQEAVALAGETPDNYEVGDIRYVEWLEDRLENPILPIREENNGFQVKVFNTHCQYCSEPVTGSPVIACWCCGKHPGYQDTVANHHGKPEDGS